MKTLKEIKSRDLVCLGNNVYANYDESNDCVIVFNSKRYNGDTVVYFDKLFWVVEGNTVNKRCFSFKNALKVAYKKSL